MKVILVPVDFSEVTAAAIDAAHALAVSFGAKVFVVHVEHLFTDELKDAPLQRPQREYLVELARTDHQQLRQLADDLKQRGCDAEPLLVRGQLVAKILDEVRRTRADMLIMGSHGHSRIYNCLIGSTCEGVLRKSDVPVLVVPSRFAESDSYETSDRREGSGRRDQRLTGQSTLTFMSN
jgi:nucleotide-binding universal stress UspA family protein